MFPSLTAKLENEEKQVLLTNGKQKKINFETSNLCLQQIFKHNFSMKKKETLKLKIDQSNCLNMFWF